MGLLRGCRPASEGAAPGSAVSSVGEELGASWSRPSRRSTIRPAATFGLLRLKGLLYRAIFSGASSPQNQASHWIRAVPDLSPLMPLRRASPMPRWAVISNDLICSAETGVDTCMGRSWAWAVQRQLLPVPPHPPCATNREWQPYRSRTCQAIQSRNTSATAWSRRSSSRFPHPMAIRHGTYKGQAVDVKQVE
jgi:hypothetical protein